MNKFHSVFILAAFVALSTTSCAWLRGACATAMPYVTTAQSYEADAQQAVNMLPSEIRAEAQLALDVANVAIIAAEGACAAIDSATTFADFVAVWVNSVEPKMRAKLIASPGTTLRVPLIVRKARGL